MQCRIGQTTEHKQAASQPATAWMRAEEQPNDQASSKTISIIKGCSIQRPKTNHHEAS
jgi:hypothetical protein